MTISLYCFVYESITIKKVFKYDNDSKINCLNNQTNVKIKNIGIGIEQNEATAHQNNSPS